MGLTTGVFIVVSAFLTAALSGVFGMAGGLALKGALALVLPVSAVFVTHGLLQLVANAWRAILHRKHVVWRIVAV
ncbi:MAG TPA: sulfite exporter TauE/SafE family protein, partial [Phenylobacterium sp.]